MQFNIPADVESGEQINTENPLNIIAADIPV